MTFVDDEGFVVNYSCGHAGKALGVLLEKEWTIYVEPKVELLKEGDLVYVSDTDADDESKVKVFVELSSLCKFKCKNLNGKVNCYWKYATKVPDEDLVTTELRLPEAALKQFNEETLYSNYATK